MQITVAPRHLVPTKRAVLRVVEMIGSDACDTVELTAILGQLPPTDTIPFNSRSITAVATEGAKK